MRFFGFVFSLLLLCGNLFSQDFVKEKTLDVNATYFSLDKLGNIYIVEEGNIFKYDSTGNKLYTFSNKGNGNIDFIDAGNPFRILVYVKNFSMIYFLDNHLALQSTLDLRQQLFTDVWPVCISGNDGFWIYDRQTFSLKKLDGTLKIIAQSQPLNLTVTDEIKPVMMQEGESYLVLLNAESGFMVYDRLGSYYKTIRKSPVTNFTLSDNMLIYFADDKMNVTDLKSGIENEYAFKTDLPAQSIGFFKNKLYVLTGNKIEIYSATK